MQVKVLDGLSSLQADNFKEAASKIASIFSLSDEESINELLPLKDLAFYATICALHSFNRNELKTLLGSPGLKSLMEYCGSGISDIIENLLNGRYLEYQRQLSLIANDLTYDIYFGYRIPKIIQEIRKKALIQYVTPYKVIDMREIARAFDLSLEAVEAEVADLIVAKQILAKIDSYSKVRQEPVIDSLASVFKKGQRDIEQLQGSGSSRLEVHSGD